MNKSIKKSKESHLIWIVSGEREKVAYFLGGASSSLVFLLVGSSNSTSGTSKGLHPLVDVEELIHKQLV